MMLIILFKGLLIGLLIALPLGPAGALSVSRGLRDGPRAGFLSGLGSTVADLIYLVLLQIGISTVSFSSNQTLLMRGLGGSIVVVIGLHMLLRKAADHPHIEKPREHTNAFLAAFLLSIINPTILLSLAVLVAGFELGEASRSRNHSLLLIAGVFSGSVLLWLLLSRWLRFVRGAQAVHKLAGAAFVSIGIAILLLAFIQS